MDLAAGTVHEGPVVTRLTTLEKRLLAHLVAAEGRDVSRGELLEQVWGHNSALVTRAVDATMNRLRAKVEHDPARPDHLITVWGTGYHFLPLRQEEDASPETSVVHLDGARYQVPAPTSGLFGRTAELDELSDLLTRSRLVTLHGPAGVGKTRLACEHAWRRRAQFQGGAWFCDLTEQRDLEGVCSAVAACLGIDNPSLSDTHALGRALRGQGPMLLVLDNFEQVVQLADATVGEWMRMAPSARFLVTSRELLRLNGEHAVQLEPLSATRDGVDLLAERIREVRPDFVLDRESRADLVRLAEELDGLPLALELAAARARVLDIDEIRLRLVDRFALLGRGRRGAPRRQATLRGSLDWSWDLLRPGEQAALAQLGSFKGGCALALAERYLGRLGTTDALDVIQSLADKSLLRMQRTGVGSRVHMLLCVREYALEKSGDDPAAVLAQAETVLEYTEPLVALAEADRSAWQALADEMANLQVIQERFAGHPQHAALSARAVLATVPVRMVRSAPESLGRSLADAIVDATGDPPVQLAVLIVAARLAFHFGMSEQAREWTGEAERLATALDDARATAEVAILRAREAWALGAFAQAVRRATRGLELSRQLDDRVLEGLSRRELCMGCWSSNLEQALEHLDAELAIWSDLGHLRQEASQLALRTKLLSDLGRNDGLSGAERAVDIARELEDQWAEALALTGLAGRLHYVGDLDGAEALLVDAWWLIDRLGSSQCRLDALFTYADLLAEAGRTAEALARYEQALELSREVDLPVRIAITEGNIQVLLLRQGKGDLDALEAAATTLGDLGANHAGSFFRAQLACLSACHDERHLAAAEQLLDGMLESRAGGVVVESVVGFLRGRVHVQRALQQAAAGADAGGDLALARLRLAGPCLGSDARTAREVLRRALAEI